MKNGTINILINIIVKWYQLFLSHQVLKNGTINNLINIIFSTSSIEKWYHYYSYQYHCKKVSFIFSSSSIVKCIINILINLWNFSSENNSLTTNTIMWHCTNLLKDNFLSLLSHYVFTYYLSNYSQNVVLKYLFTEVWAHF